MPLSKIQTIKSRGFTIVELAVVIVIIGILAGLVATSYNGWQKSIAEKEVRSEINIALAAVKSARNFSPDPITAMPNTYKSNARVTLVYIAGTGSEFCIDGSSNAKTNITLFVRQDGVVKKGTCAGGEIPDYLPEGTTILVASSVSAGLNNTCVISAGKVYCAGYNAEGQLGNKSNATSGKPVAVDTSGVLSGKTVTAISSGYSHNCALADGLVYCWGSNGAGQLGDGTTTNRNEPVAVSTAASSALNGKTVTKIAAGRNFTCAIATGLAYCWGANNYGQLGNNASPTASLIPVAVTSTGALNGKTVTQIDAGVEHVCAIANNAAHCWGTGYDGRLGNGGLVQSNVPVLVTATAGVLGGKTVTQIDAGHYSTCATAAGQAYCWGENNNGQLGIGNNTTPDESSVPVAVTTAAGVLGGKTVTSVSTQTTDACALANGLVYCWGRNATGGHGNGTYDPSYAPTAVNTSGVLSGKALTSVVTGANFSCGLSSGSVYCWGINNHGQLGEIWDINDWSTHYRTTPVKMSNP